MFVKRFTFQIQRVYASLKPNNLFVFVKLFMKHNAIQTTFEKYMLLKKEILHAFETSCSIFH
jgi:hypothetical protein